MQERDTSGNITPPPSANESEPQDIMIGNEMGEGSHLKNATYYRQQKRRSKTFYQPPYHVSNPPHFQSYSNLSGPSAHTSYTETLPSVKIPFGTHHKVCNGFQQQHNQSIQNPYLRLVHSTLLLPTAVTPCTYVAL